MTLIVILIAVLIACFLFMVVFQRMKASKKGPVAYVCTTCGEMDCICHQKDHMAGG